MSKVDGQGRRKFLKNSVATALAATSWGWTTGAARAEDAAASHSMLIVGEQTVFLSHLPLFHAPHNYQVIMEASFAKPGSDPQADYFADRKKHPGTKIYTLEPEPFVLTRLSAAEPLRSFKANLYRGQFELLDARRKESARFGEKVDVNVTRVIQFRKLDPTAANPAQLEYILFGKGSELFLAHSITRPPDFDQVLSVKVPTQQFTTDELSHGVQIVIPGRANSESKRIKGTGPVTAQIKATGGAMPKTLQLQPGDEFYFNTDDFRS